MAFRTADVHVGKRIRERRIELGLSQEKLAEALGITFQQVQKNERGANRVGSSRLHELCTILNVDANYFFDGLPRFEHAGRSRKAATGDKSGRGDRMRLELMRHFGAIEDPRMRRAIMLQAKAAAEIEKKASPQKGGTVTRSRRRKGDVVSLAEVRKTRRAA